MVLLEKAVPEQYRKWVIAAGQQCPEVSSPLIAAQIEAESNWDPYAASRNPETHEVIAEGISQFIPATWATWGVDADGDGKANVYTPADAIMTQARYDCYLAKVVKSYNLAGDQTKLMLAAYNAGPYAVQRAGGVPQIPETLDYVSKITALMAKYSRAMQDGGPTSEFGQRVADNAKKWIGTPYSWGGGSVDGPSFGFAQGASTRGFDCSSLVQYAVYHASDGKIMLPRTSQIQATQGKAIDPADIRVGDVIAFALSGAGDYDHIAVYVGQGQFVHAPRTGDNVKVSSLGDSYYSSKPKTIRRFGQ
ncbi:C40 family peptidase [Streptomyces sp. NBC_01431]|uniref:C40 family peptidase n=1 Tax=Streptomyces sp. NBC_01431 TaxID=2903863 RepID=UPI002E30599D|nr:NlpC/P60 family protein [Streptomyces sp. NBC_01431]